MKAIGAILLLTATIVGGQSFPRDGALASSTPPSGNVKFSPVAGSITGAKTICLYSGSSCGNNIANTDIFYTLDGSAATPASTWYPCAGNTSGCITIPDPSATRMIIINAVLVQTTSTTASGCSVGSPCVGVIVQDGTNVQSRLKLNLACTSTQCPASNFTNPPATIQFGTASNNNGVRGVISSADFNYGQSEPTVDVYGNTNTAVDYEMATKGSTLAGGPDTEYLVNYDSSSQELSSPGCAHCTNFDVSRYIAHNYQGTSSSTQNAANLADLESDDNLYDSSQGTSTQCGASPTVACYGAFNFRCAPADLTVTVGGIKYGGYQHSSQTSNWKSFQPAVTVIPSYDCTYPFGTTSVISDFTSCNITFTPGAVNYNSQMSWGIDPGANLYIDQGTSKAETVHILTTSGNTVLTCIRGLGSNGAHTHSAGALASESVLFQAGAIKDTTLAAGGSGAATCTTGTREPVAMYYNYMNINGHVYGTAAAQVLLPNTTILGTWGTQSVNGTPHSNLCDYYGLSQIFDYGTGRFFDQIQPYIKFGSGVSALVAIYTQHDNFTAHFGVIGSPAQVVYTQNP